MAAGGVLLVAERRPGAERAVDDELHGPDADAVAGQDVPGPPARGDRLLQPVRPDARGDADGGFGAAGPRVDRRVLEVDQARDPAGGRGRRRLGDPAVLHGVVHGARAGHQLHRRRLDEDPGRVLHPEPAGCGGVQPDGVQVRAHDEHGTFAEPGVEDAAVRRGVPQRVAVAVADDEVLPWARPRLQERGRLGGRARGQDVDAAAGRGPLREVHVAVDEARQQHGTVGVEAFGRRPGTGPRQTGADRDDATVRERHVDDVTPEGWATDVVQDEHWCLRSGGTVQTSCRSRRAGGRPGPHPLPYRARRSASRGSGPRSSVRSVDAVPATATSPPVSVRRTRAPVAARTSSVEAAGWP